MPYSLWKKKTWLLNDNIQLAPVSSTWENLAVTCLTVTNYQTSQSSEPPWNVMHPWQRTKSKDHSANKEAKMTTTPHPHPYHPMAHSAPWMDPTRKGMKNATKATMKKVNTNSKKKKKKKYKYKEKTSTTKTKKTKMWTTIHNNWRHWRWQPYQFLLTIIHVCLEQHCHTMKETTRIYLTLLYSKLYKTPSTGTWNYKQYIIFTLSCSIARQTAGQIDRTLCYTLHVMFH